MSDKLIEYLRGGWSEYTDFLDNYLEEQEYKKTMELQCKRLKGRICEGGNRDDYSYKARRKYYASKVFGLVLNRLQGIWCKACARFDGEYMNNLEEKLLGDYSLQNIHRNIPNKDQKYLNYLYFLLTNDRIFIDMDHKIVLTLRFNECYQECRKLGIRPCFLNILQICLVGLSADYDYIKPFIYTKFKLSKDIEKKLLGCLEK